MEIYCNKHDKNLLVLTFFSLQLLRQIFRFPSVAHTFQIIAHHCYNAESSNIAQDKLVGLLDEKILISLDQLFLESTLTLRTLINKGPDHVGSTIT